MPVWIDVINPWQKNIMHTIIYCRHILGSLQSAMTSKATLPVEKKLAPEPLNRISPDKLSNDMSQL